MNYSYHTLVLLKFVCFLEIILSNQFDDLSISETDSVHNRNRLTYPKFQIKSILEDCAPSKRNNLTNSQIIKSNTFEDLTDCIQKLSLNIKITNHGVYQQRTHYIIIDHIVDAISNKKIQILNPYIIKLRQDPIVEQYSLNYEQTVNGEPKELIFNQHSDNYNGCSLDITNPTCPLMKINEQIVPYSTGFCCSCNQRKNPPDDVSPIELLNQLEQQPRAKLLDESLTSYQGLDGKMVYDADKSENYQQLLDDGGKYVEGLLSSGDLPNFYCDEIGKVIDVVRVILQKSWFYRPIKGRKRKGCRNETGRHPTNVCIYSNCNDKIDKIRGSVFELLSKLQYYSTAVVKQTGAYTFCHLCFRYPLELSDLFRFVVKRQRRDGQNCDDSSIPDRLSESTHCLQFSNSWYKIYGLKRPKIRHKIRLQIFQKFDDHWRSLTQNKIIHLDTKHSYYNFKNLQIKYQTDELELGNGPILNYKQQKLLMPEQQDNVDPSQFMIVPTDMITYDGSSCNKIGVGYEAFYKQKKRCYIDKGSCLRNQPLHLYQNDINAGKRGENGRYFLKYYGMLPDDIIRRNTTGHETHIKFLYTKTHQSFIDLAINADHLPLILPEIYATINEIYIDTTDATQIRIIAKITNSGLLNGIFYIRLGECPLEIPANFNNIVTKSVLIPPQQQHIFDLTIHARLPMAMFFCTIFIQNRHQEIIASRRIRFVKDDRCFCIWYCKCVCYRTDNDRKCYPLSLESYQLAGYQGGPPVPIKLLRPTKLDRILARFCYMFLILIVTFLLMGIIKALFGLYFKQISLWGLDVIIGDYCDKHCNCRCRHQNIALPAQFCLNIIFFFVYPLAIMRDLCMERITDEKQNCDTNLIFYQKPIQLSHTPEESIVFTDFTDDECAEKYDEINEYVICDCGM